MSGVPRTAEPPHIYPFAAVLAERLGCTTIVDIGCGGPLQLSALRSRFDIVAVGAPARLARYRELCPDGRLIDLDPSVSSRIPVTDEVLSRSVLVSVDTVEHLPKPSSLLHTIEASLHAAPACLIAATDREPAQLEQLLRSAGLCVHFTGWTAASEDRPEKTVALAVLGSWFGDDIPASPPDSFRVAAIIPTFNEADVVVPSVRRLLAQDVLVYVVDNWSTDGTYEQMHAMHHPRLLVTERFPPSGPEKSWNLGDLLRRIDDVGTRLDCDWIVYHDVDEVREAPWPGTSLREAIYRVDRSGFNAIDHTVLNFKPTDDSFRPGDEFWKYFHHWEFGASPLRVPHVKAWKATGHGVGLDSGGGHTIDFPGRRIFPYNFLLRHYRIRSQAHGERKVLVERLPRLNPDERARGWNLHYEALAELPSFIARPEDLAVYEETEFNRRYLVERLSGVGITR